MVGESFDWCLNNLAKVLKRCEDCNLVLNWEKIHFMVKEGIVLSHRVSENGIEVDQAKVEVIEKLPPPTRSRCENFSWACFFYRRFIKDFPKIAHPLCKLLEKDCEFYFDESCLKAFTKLKRKLVSAPTIISLNWGELF